jgi:hypothetical protein
MSVIQNQLSLAAGASSNNLISGSAFEFARTQQLVSIGVAATLTGAFIGITVGADLVLEDTPPAVITAATNGGYPIIPDEMYYNDVAQPGDRIVIRARNPTGGAIVLSWVVQISAIR